MLEAPEPVEVSLALTEAGIDLLLHADRPAARMEHVRLAGLADGLDLARVSWITAGAVEPEPIVTRRLPMIHLGEVAVELPPGGFLQATAFGEAERELEQPLRGLAGDHQRLARLGRVDAQHHQRHRVAAQRRPQQRVHAGVDADQRDAAGLYDGLFDTSVWELFLATEPAPARVVADQGIYPSEKGNAGLVPAFFYARSHALAAGGELSYLCAKRISAMQNR